MRNFKSLDFTTWWNRNFQDTEIFKNEAIYETLSTHCAVSNFNLEISSLNLK